MLNIGVIGCSGKMGRAIMAETINNPKCNLAAGFIREGSNFEGFDLGELAGKYEINIKASTNLEDVIKASDAIINFSTPTLSLEVAGLCAEMQKTLIDGTTGFSEDEKKEFKSYSTNTQIVWSSNMSIGVNLINCLVRQAAQILGNDYNAEIIEMHHKNKKDAPSGTALTLGETIANARKTSLTKVARMSREGIIGARSDDEIGFATLRGGSVIGDHEVLFAGDDDIIAISHRALNRNIFAKGAIFAALWANQKPAGYYSMEDILTME
jgi:4-hydroxy-tetrahydrodipicolinate reductase